MSLEASGERFRIFREAPIEDRCALIRAHYDRQRADRVARYEHRHGPGSVEQHRAEAEARAIPASRPGGYYGIGGNLSGSEYAAGGYQVGGRARR